jgi:hypothetical protein
MRKTRAASVGQLLGSGVSASLLTQSRLLKRLSDHLSGILPPPLNEHCALLNLRGDTLILGADTPVWAARLRYYAPLLVKHLSPNNSVTVRTIRVRVSPRTVSAAAVPSRRRCRLSPETAGILRQTAAALSDQKLKTALMKLASHTG